MKPIGRTNGRRGFPSEDRSKPSPEWNHYRIVANNGSIRLSVNGKEVSGGDECNYRKGYLALESEGAPVEFRNIRIKELPSTHTPPELTAPIDPGWRCLFNGVDLRGWRTNAATASRWSVSEEKVALKPAAATGGGTGISAAPTLWTEADFGDAEFIVDYQPPKASDGETLQPASVLVRGANQAGTRIPLTGAEAGKFSRFIITVQGSTVRVLREGQPPTEVTLAGGAPARGRFGLAPTASSGVFMNLHARNL
jgi:hypothetical protein